MKLRQLAHARTGDKGDTSNISVIAYEAEHYDRLRTALPAEKVRSYLATLFPAEVSARELSVQRYELPRLHALNFVVHGVLRGGVTRSLALDAHGKSLGSILLDMEIQPDQITTSAAR